MSLNNNKNLKIVGFFGQSGAGKSAIIINSESKIDNKKVLKNTGIIRFLFKKNTYYVDPQTILDQKDDVFDISDVNERNKKIDELYDSYVRSQFQLLNDWSTEIYNTTTESYIGSSILLIDRSPIDFYVSTLCGIACLKDTYKRPLNETCEILLGLIKKTTTETSNDFFNAIVIVKPWKNPKSVNLKDGIRDQYLNNFYIGENWYDGFNDIPINKEVKVFTVDETIIDIQKRVAIVNKKLKEL